MIPQHPITPLQRWLLRIPIWLYRIGLGRLLGTRFLLLKHQGRRSGRIHATVLEVVHSTPTSYTVVAGWGNQSDWLQNIQINPHVSIQIANTTHQAKARRLAASEAIQILQAYAQLHPRTLSVIGKWFVGKHFTGSPDELIALGQHLPVVTIQI